MLRLTTAVLFFLTGSLHAEKWLLDAVDDSMMPRGSVRTAAGAAGQSLVLDGDSLIELKDSAGLASGEFTVSLWVNPYDLAGGQQMLVGKNRYSRDERQWGLILEPDGRLKAYLHQGGWRTISCAEPIKAGAWHLVTLAVAADKASLYLNGKPVGEAPLATPITATEAPITLGGIWDAENLRQAFHGALDEFAVQPGVRTSEEIAASYRPVTTTHEVPASAAGLPLWDAAKPMPKASELPQAAGAEFHVIKKKRPDKDGAKWTLGVGLAWHKGRLYASYGFNQGHENTPTEEAHVKVSEDGGKTWSAPVVMDDGEGNLGVSHGVFLSHEGKLWAFMGAFYDKFQRTHTRAYVLNETSGEWEKRGVVVDGGFWPMQEPQRMADGNWIMAGARVDRGDGDQSAVPAVAISHGDDFTKWDLIAIPTAPGLGKIWGESTVIVEGPRITNLSRYGKKALALLSTSEDFGRTWTPSAPSNLPMATSKPYAGTLSTGQRFLVCTTTADTGGRRSPLTIAVSKPGETLFSKVFLIRPSVFEGTPGVSDARADFSYPYAVEHEGKLYIGYTHKSHAANELAVVPVASLQVPEPVALWKGSAIPEATDIPVIKGVRFSVIKPYEFEKDGCRFLHGVGLAFHNGKLYASFGHKQGAENTVTEEAHYRVSEDGGKTWGPLRVIDAGEEENLAVSHGVFLSLEGTLWAFQGAYYNKMENIHTRAYTLDEATGEWKNHGIEVENGFWALNQPVKMDDGNWIMPGGSFGVYSNDNVFPAAVAISHGDDFTKWDFVRIEPDEEIERMWGESSLFVDGSKVYNIARYGGGAQALVAVSEDYGRTWTPTEVSNLPMATSKPAAGVLGTSQRYLVCTTATNNGGRRSPLTIAVSRSGENRFSKMFVIRRSQHDAPGESAERLSLSYPYAIEHEGKLYVGYSNNGGRRGNLKSAELAVIPVRALMIE